MVDVDIINGNITDSSGDGHIDFAAPYAVYNLSGQQLGNDINSMSAGLYIVRQGANVKKITVK